MSIKCVFIALLLFLVMQLARSCKLYDNLCSRVEPILVFSKIQPLLHLFPPQMVEIKQISIIPHDKWMDGFYSFQAIHHFWEGEQEQPSNDTLESFLRTPI